MAEKLGEGRGQQTLRRRPKTAAETVAANTRKHLDSLLPLGYKGTMNEEEYQEMMRDLMNDPAYLAYEAERDRETMELQGRLSDEEIAAL